MKSIYQLVFEEGTNCARTTLDIQTLNTKFTKALKSLFEIHHAFFAAIDLEHAKAVVFCARHGLWIGDAFLHTDEYTIRRTHRRNFKLEQSISEPGFGIYDDHRIGVIRDIVQTDIQ